MILWYFYEIKIGRFPQAMKLREIELYGKWYFRKVGKIIRKTRIRQDWNGRTVKTLQGESNFDWRGCAVELPLNTKIVKMLPKSTLTEFGHMSKNNHTLRHTFHNWANPIKKLQELLNTSSPQGTRTGTNTIFTVVEETATKKTMRSNVKINVLSFDSEHTTSFLVGSKCPRALNPQILHQLIESALRNCHFTSIKTTSKIF